MLKQINNAIEKIESTISIFILGVIVVLVFAAATARSLGSPIIWSVEIAQILFMILSFLCVDLTLKRNQHIGISYFVEKTSIKTQKILQLIVLVLMLAFSIFALIKGFDMINLYKFRRFSATGIGYKYVMLILPIATTIMTITIFGKIEESLVNFNKIEDAGIEELKNA